MKLWSPSPPWDELRSVSTFFRFDANLDLPARLKGRLTQTRRHDPGVTAVDLEKPSLLSHETVGVEAETAGAYLDLIGLDFTFRDVALLIAVTKNECLPLPGRLGNRRQGEFGGFQAHFEAVPVEIRDPELRDRGKRTDERRPAPGPAAPAFLRGRATCVGNAIATRGHPALRTSRA